MESDCEDSSSTKMASPSSNANILHMLLAISSKMISNYQSLQDKLLQNDQQLSAEFQRVIKDYETFKKDVRVELDSL
jgi:hypothetical protein